MIVLREDLLREENKMVLYISLAIGGIFSLLLLFEILFVIRHKKWSFKIMQPEDTMPYPGVSVIHPIKDADFELDLNKESWLCQNYTGSVEHIFSFQDPEDEAIPIIRKLIEKHPEMDLKIIVNPVSEGMNGKTSNMVNGILIAKYDFLVFGDSDTRVKEDMLLKMVQPLLSIRTGITTCGQINRGGRDFSTRLFTFIQNNETVFLWSVFCGIGLNMGMTGAAFAMRRKLLKRVGGLERYGNTLLEDLYLGREVHKRGYKLVLGPYIECNNDKLHISKAINYAKRIAIGIKEHISLDIPVFALMMSWYWLIIAIGLIVGNSTVILMGSGFLLLRALTGIIHRLIAEDKLVWHDIVIALIFDFIAIYMLLFLPRKAGVDWRGVKYENG